MIGYWNKPDETAKTITADGWFKTGDAGYLDDDGYLYIHDRVKDMIISGGENIYPAEIENVPHVASRRSPTSRVIGVPERQVGRDGEGPRGQGGGHRPDARQRSSPSPASASRHFKCPTSVDFVDALPRNPSGKILKKDLRAPYWAGRERNVN